MRVLVVEDNTLLRTSLQTALQRAGYAVDAAADGPAALWALEPGHHDLVVLDIMLPGIDGLSVLGKLRAGGNAVPVLLLTARQDTRDRVAGLDGGADDYLPKPFAMEELLARVRALLRRGKDLPRDVRTVGPLAVDAAGRTALLDGQPMVLTAREFEILDLLVRAGGQAVARRTLRLKIWGEDEDPESNTLDVHMAGLRRKLGPHAGMVRTLRGHGYLLGEPAP